MSKIRSKGDAVPLNSTLVRLQDCDGNLERLGNECKGKEEVRDLLI